MAKRIGVPKAKPGELIVKWGRCEPGEPPEVVYNWGGEGATKRDSMMLAHALENQTLLNGKTLMQELEDRGYDITTLKFTIQQKQQPSN